MPYAANDKISKSPIEGGIEITDKQYKQAINGMRSGLIVRIENNAMKLVDPPKERNTYWMPPAKQHKTQPGEDPPAEAVTVPPPDDFHIIEDGQWVYSQQREREAMVLTRYQARAALHDAGLLDDVDTLMADANTSAEIKIMWEHKERIRRTHSATIQMATALGWTADQLDDLFRAGMQIDP